MVKQKQFLRVALGIAIAAFGLVAEITACSSRPPPISSTAVIGVDLPFAGRDGGDGIMALHGVDMAIADANALAGQTLHFALAIRDTSRGGFQDPHVDEATDPIFDDAHGAQDIEAFANDAKVLGVLGPFESNVALAEIPIATREHLALISASARDDRLTHIHNASTFFRLCPPYLADAYGAARAAYGSGASRIFVIDDGVARERAQTRAFVTTVAKTPMRIAGSQSYGSDFTTLLERLHSTRADTAVYFGPSPTNVLIMRPKLVRSVLAPSRVRFMADSGFLPPAFGVSNNGSTAYYTIWPDPNTHSTAAAAFDAEFRERYAVGAPPEAMAYYVATQVLVESIASASRACGCTPNRTGVVKALRTYRRVDSLIGRVAFTSTGELVSWRMALVRIRGSSYTVAGEFTVAPP